MSSPTVSPSQTQQVLGAELRRLRNEKGLSGRTVGQLAALSQSKLSKIESGKLRPSHEDITSILTALDSPRYVQDQIFEYLNQLHFGTNASPEFLDLQIEAQLEEENATLIRCNANNAIPGLLQTPAFIRYGYENIWLPNNNTPEEITRRTIRRLQRQAILGDLNRSFRFIISLPLLNSLLDLGDIGQRQLQKLENSMHEPNIEIAIFDPSKASPWGSNIHTHILDDYVVYIESLMIGLRRSSTAEIQAFIRCFEEMWTIADRDEVALAHINSRREQVINLASNSSQS